MNNTIKLDDKWSIEPDVYSWKLIFSEERMKDEKIKVDGKIKKTGKQVPFLHVDEWYFPKINQCLDKYLTEVFKSDKTISEMSHRLSGIESKVNQINATFKKQ